MENTELVIHLSSYVICVHLPLMFLQLVSEESSGKKGAKSQGPWRGRGCVWGGEGGLITLNFFFFSLSPHTSMIHQCKNGDCRPENQVVN